MSAGQVTTDVDPFAGVTTEQRLAMVLTSKALGTRLALISEETGSRSTFTILERKALLNEAAHRLHSGARL